MLVFIPGLPQRIAMIPNLNNQSAQPYRTMIEVGEWYLVDSKMMRLILQMTINHFGTQGAIK
jgi:hypothetical protein